MSAAQDMDRATKAQAILDSPAYQAAYAGVRQAIFDRLESCSLTDTQTAEDLRRCLKLLKDVQGNMLAALQSGKVAQFRLSEQERRNRNPLRGLFR